jgi:hypothetical protein
MKEDRLRYKILWVALLVFVSFGFKFSQCRAQGLKDLLFSTSQWKGFRITGSPEYYHPDDLWVYLNGGAPAYVDYGLEEMVAFRVTPVDGSVEIETNLFDMGSNLNAFGIFSAERPPDGRSATYGVDAHRSDSTLFFWQNRYYVKIIAYDPNHETGEFLSLLARILSDALPKKGNRPQLFSAFPSKGRVHNSEHYIRRDVLGHHYFHDGYRVLYKKNGGEYQIYLIRGTDKKTVTPNVAKYIVFMKGDAENIDDDCGIGEQCFSGTHEFYGSVLCARRGKDIIVILGHDNRERTREIVIEMFEQLEEIDAESPS